ncbi:ubiquitin-related modifier 1 isoform X1 [Rhinatrema bivittatum]|uniref:ubiquitin-related modifier 1 isoform X1 n=1 Tax=Rhinatrema bivittatum TaxID=194408 RepID=UPI001126C1C9|nr:ubiquitin-related modifier 1 isoform X1 [Rhinatrema bivittatum]
MQRHPPYGNGLKERHFRDKFSVHILYGSSKMAAPISLQLEFGGGAELLFGGIKKHHVTLPSQSDPSLTKKNFQAKLMLPMHITSCRLQETAVFGIMGYRTLADVDQTEPVTRETGALYSRGHCEAWYLGAHQRL